MTEKGHIGEKNLHVRERVDYGIELGTDYFLSPSTNENVSFLVFSFPFISRIRKSTKNEINFPVIILRAGIGSF